MARVPTKAAGVSYPSEECGRGVLKSYFLFGDSAARVVDAEEQALVQ